ncbi:MAG: hypothetical protein E7609_06175 [Ruminococcaceae bacterium]|nr:hypothetical protein [Oscillospiraceae bacterium]
MKRVVLVLLLLASLLFLPFTVSAAETDASPTALEKITEETRDGLLSLLPDVAKQHLSDPTDGTAVKDALGFRSLFSLLANAITNGETKLGGRMSALFALSVLFGAVSLFVKGSTAAVFMQSAAALSFFSLLFETTSHILGFFSDLASFATGISPILVTLLAAGGGTATAAAANGGFAAFLSVLTLFSTTVLPPLLRLLFALALLSALGNHTLIRELSGRISGIAVLLFSVLSMLLLASLAFQSALASSADSVALRTVKYTASSAIPLVGGTLSGALGALTASLSLLKNTLGGTAVIVLLSLLLPPLVEVFLLRLTLSFSESLATFTEASSLREVIARFRGILDLALAALVIVSLLFLLTIGVFVGISPFG